ncbi:MAG: CHAT domain-containing protein [Bacteroidota bacterium]
MANIPIILLAFANDREGRFLRSIAEEQRSIRKALAPLVEKKLLQLEELPNATAEDIFDAFRSFGDRIRIFHYGGHAQDLELMLSGSKKPLDVRGLAQFLGQQKGIELVFMNGCATAAQQTPFQKAGIPRLILTDTPISDQAALNFASQFFQSLAVGHPISQSFEEAEGATVAQLGGQRRSLVFEEVEEQKDSVLPWRLYDPEQEPWALATKAPFPWKITGIAASLLIVTCLGTYWFWMNVLPFDMRLPIQYPDGTSAQLHFATPHNDIHHFLRVHLPDRKLELELERGSALEIPQVKGSHGKVPISLDSKFLILEDSLIEISKTPEALRLLWHPNLTRIQGWVRGESGESLEGVQIQLGDTSISSGEDGRFVLPVKAEDVPKLVHTLRWQKAGYQARSASYKLHADLDEIELVLLRE